MGITWKRRGFNDKGGALQHSPYRRKKKGRRKAREQRNNLLAAARISRKKEDRNHGIHKHEKGINAAKRETLIRARKSRALSQLTESGVGGQGPPRSEPGGHQEWFYASYYLPGFFFFGMLESWHSKSEV
jgi:hypothetical protein